MEYLEWIEIISTAKPETKVTEDDKEVYKIHFKGSLITVQNQNGEFRLQVPYKENPLQDISSWFNWSEIESMRWEKIKK